MGPEDEQHPEQGEPPASPKRRVVFPWLWLGLLLGARLAFQLTDFTVDFKALATMATIGLGTIGVALWYAVRGRGPAPLRLAVGVAPFVAFFALNSFYELRHSGDGWVVGMHRRGAEKPDEQLDQLDAAADEGLADWGPGQYDYPRFLGVGPWAEAVGPPLQTDWQATPPKELWRRPIGAGWSSFAVNGRYAITQEQRGDEELVVCYEAETGEPAWSHADTVRFDPQDFGGQMGRAGPRATPTIVGDRVYTQGATGLVNCLDCRTGDVVWRVDLVEAFGVATPVWGRSGSPLYVPSDTDSDLVVVNVGAPLGATEGSHDASLVAFDAASGDVAWKTGWRQTSYASPQLMTLAGERLVLQTSDDVLTAHMAETGTKVFEYPWAGQSDNMPSCSQPLAVGDDRVLLTKGYAHGSALLQVARDGDVWTAEPVWSPAILRKVLQTKFSNAVVRDGYAYGLSGVMLQCVEIDSGDIVWRKRRSPSFGFGQLLLTGEHLLVLTENSGEVVIAAASPAGYEELASAEVLSPDEVCWNNPVLVGDLLLVRNSVEAAAYLLPTAGNAEPEGAFAAR